MENHVPPLARGGFMTDRQAYSWMAFAHKHKRLLSRRRFAHLQRGTCTPVIDALQFPCRLDCSGQGIAHLDDPAPACD